MALTSSLCVHVFRLKATRFLCAAFSGVLGQRIIPHFFLRMLDSSLGSGLLDSIAYKLCIFHRLFPQGVRRETAFIGSFFFLLSHFLHLGRRTVQTRLGFATQRRPCKQGWKHHALKMRPLLGKGVGGHWNGLLCTLNTEGRKGE
jgi:hypothetical protein